MRIIRVLALLLCSLCGIGTVSAKDILSNFNQLSPKKEAVRDFNTLVDMIRRYGGVTEPRRAARMISAILFHEAIKIESFGGGGLLDLEGRIYRPWFFLQNFVYAIEHQLGVYSENHERTLRVLRNMFGIQIGSIVYKITILNNQSALLKQSPEINSLSAGGVKGEIQSEPEAETVRQAPAKVSPPAEDIELPPPPSVPEPPPNPPTAMPRQQAPATAEPSEYK